MYKLEQLPPGRAALLWPRREQTELSDKVQFHHDITRKSRKRLICCSLKIRRWDSPFNSHYRSFIYLIEANVIHFVCGKSSARVSGKTRGRQIDSMTAMMTWPGRVQRGALLSVLTDGDTRFTHQSVPLSQLMHTQHIHVHTNTLHPNCHRGRDKRAFRYQELLLYR